VKEMPINLKKLAKEHIKSKRSANDSKSRKKMIANHKKMSFAGALAKNISLQKKIDSLPAQFKAGSVSLKKLAKALYCANGLQTLAAKRIGISHGRVSQLVLEYPVLREVIDLALEKRIDFAEDILGKMIKSKNTAATLFFLKTRAQKRGYIERPQVEIGGDVTIRIKYEDTSRSTESKET
jgi:hypothetical protein